MLLKVPLVLFPRTHSYEVTSAIVLVMWKSGWNAGIMVGMWRIRVEMWGMGVGLRVYKYLTGILQGFF